MFSCDYWEIFRNRFFYWTPPVGAPENMNSFTKRLKDLSNSKRKYTLRNLSFRAFHKIHFQGSLLNYVPFVPTCLTCLSTLRPYVPSCLKLLRAYVPYITTCLRAYVPRCLTCLRTYVLYVPLYLNSLIYVPTCPLLLRT